MNETEETTVEPRRGPGRPKGSKNKPKTKAAGTDLVPDLSRHKSGVSVQYAFWVGCLPSSPCERIDVAGIAFPKMTEEVTGRGRDTKRSPQAGVIVHLSRNQVEKLLERLPNVIIRFLSGSKPDPDAEYSLSDVMPRMKTLADGKTVTVYPDRRKGYPLTIPTDEEMARAGSQGAHKRPYTAMPLDEPAADYIFAQLCEDQDRPETSKYYPEPLSKTGLAWPGED